ncbi:MAG: anaerobic ribonucleoside-triphosphate reductase activating protein [Deltaproteobacteria bacterium]|nr:anaerobic ribonucleoside-triphosphate reductase activating protein [Deltaproteobacteria bacterium]RLB15748.1 MAG: anaerobic ribonucleoside-triphosphate reductase activating protein [Deltaproteobacteria bacterium]RLB23939.1 MAG: anaerobic ribonucleoside-triphosphate reductase activating protein [Deltaproteobacteria bacterium]
MIIGGFQRFSLIDYPDKICAIVFTQGCNFRCPYCHNPELVDPKKFGIELKEDEILSFLGRRKGKLNAVTITGGEPLLQTDLSPFLSAIKRLGYLVKLDTNGSFPSRLKKIIELESVDYVAMDIKTSLAKYPQVIKTKIDTRKILDSIRLIMDSGLDYEFRTTIVKALFEKDDFYKIGQLIKNARLYVLQKFVPSKTLDDTFLDMKSCTDEELDCFKEIMDGFVQRCIIR